MFSRKELIWSLNSIGACMLALAGFAADPVENGFGILTLWIAPVLLVSGLCGLGVILTRPLVPPRPWPAISADPWRCAGAICVSIISLVVYISTLEPTASLWDCSEFIAASYKLQIPHTPGNPLLLIFGRLFSMLALGDPLRVAWFINAMSAFFSAMTVGLTFICIHHVGAATVKTENWKLSSAALVGSLILAFSDTFWFSAVEAETYATSSFFMVLLFLLILKGMQFDMKRQDKMLVLILYVSGLAFCIHPMTLLVLPLLPTLWYMKNKRLNIKNLLLPFIFGIGLVLFINRFISVGIFEFAFYLDLFLVNTLGAPFYSGLICLLLAIGIGFATFIRKFPSLQRYAYALVFLLLGFLPYATLFIRSNHNPPIDESNPENLALIKAYMNREGYPTRPLLYGPYFDAEVINATAAGKAYYKNNREYHVAGNFLEYEYTPQRQTLFPRIYSNDPDHISSYRNWTGVMEDHKPTFIDNVEFMLKYQIGHMYVRYLLFNFAGRTSDVQNSPWLKPWEALRNPSNAFESKARNQYWGIPLALGVMGMVFILRKNRFAGLAISGFFLLTGLLLVIYINSTPNEPRERDYIYVGSYISFAIFCGLGALKILVLPKIKIVTSFLLILLACIPIWMAIQNFDDHNRHGRTFQVDNARNVLSSCKPNSILFTGGDNDTFPLWYLQEVEGFRTDVRVMVLSYLNTDWYINQLRKQYYDSAPFKLSLNEADYRQYGPNDVLYLHEQIASAVDAKKYLTLLNNDHPGLQVQTADDDYYNLLPSRSLSIPSMRNNVTLAVKGNFLSKNTLAFIDLVTNNPERAIHFNFTSLNQLGLNVSRYSAMIGQVYEFTSEANSSDNVRVDTKLAYQNLMEYIDLSNLERNDFYLNYEDHEARMITPLRQSYNALATALIQEGDMAKAEEVLQHAESFLYAEHLKPSFPNIHAADIFMNLGKKDKAEKLATSLFDYCSYQIQTSEADQLTLQLMRYSAELLNELGKPEYLKQVAEL